MCSSDGAVYYFGTLHCTSVCNLYGKVCGRLHKFILFENYNIVPNIMWNKLICIYIIAWLLVLSIVLPKFGTNSPNDGRSASHLSLMPQMLENSPHLILTHILGNLQNADLC